MSATATPSARCRRAQLRQQHVRCPRRAAWYRPLGTGGRHGGAFRHGRRREAGVAACSMMKAAIPVDWEDWPIRGCWRRPPRWCSTHGLLVQRGGGIGGRVVACGKPAGCGGNKCGALRWHCRQGLLCAAGLSFAAATRATPRGRLLACTYPPMPVTRIVDIGQPLVTTASPEGIRPLTHYMRMIASALCPRRVPPFGGDGC